MGLLLQRQPERNPESLARIVAQAGRDNLAEQSRREQLQQQSQENLIAQSRARADQARLVTGFLRQNQADLNQAQLAVEADRRADETLILNQRAANRADANLLLDIEDTLADNARSDAFLGIQQDQNRRANAKDRREADADAQLLDLLSGDDGGTGIGPQPARPASNIPQALRERYDTYLSALPPANGLTPQQEEQLSAVEQSGGDVQLAREQMIKRNQDARPAVGSDKRAVPREVTFFGGMNDPNETRRKGFAGDDLSKGVFTSINFAEMLEMGIDPNNPGEANKKMIMSDYEREVVVDQPDGTVKTFRIPIRDSGPNLSRSSKVDLSPEAIEKVFEGNAKVGRNSVSLGGKTPVVRTRIVPKGGTRMGELNDRRAVIAGKIRELSGLTGLSRAQNLARQKKLGALTTELHRISDEMDEIQGSAKAASDGKPNDLTDTQRRAAEESIVSFQRMVEKLDEGVLKYVQKNGISLSPDSVRTWRSYKKKSERDPDKGEVWWINFPTESGRMEVETNETNNSFYKEAKSLAEKASSGIFDLTDAGYLDPDTLTWGPGQKLLPESGKTGVNRYFDTLGIE